LLNEPPGIEVPDIKLVLLAALDRRYRAGDLPGYESFAAGWSFMVEQYAGDPVRRICSQSSTKSPRVARVQIFFRERELVRDFSSRIPASAGWRRLAIDFLVPGVLNPPSNSMHR
jgi:hypothetical protein